MSSESRRHQARPYPGIRELLVAPTLGRCQDPPSLWLKRYPAMERIPPNAWPAEGHRSRPLSRFQSVLRRLEYRNDTRFPGENPAERTLFRQQEFSIVSETLVDAHPLLLPAGS